METATFLGLDVHKSTIAVGLAEGGRQGEIRYLSEVANRRDAVGKLVEKLGAKHERLSFCYEAGPTGYGLHRQIVSLGHACSVVAPSLIPRRPGERVKTDRRDATSLAALHRAGELTAIWVPDADHEAMRDLSRAREAAVRCLRRARQQLLGFLLRHDRAYSGRSHWSKAHRRWLAEISFDHPAQQIVLEELRQAIEEAEAQRDRLAREMEDLVPNWSLASVVRAIQAMRGIAAISAITLVAEIGDFRRFASPKQLMAYLGRGGITKAGNTRARRILVEDAWTYRMAPRVGVAIQDRSQGLPKDVRDIAWKAQLRLCKRYRRLTDQGKCKNVVTVAIAREMAAFIWAIATRPEVAPQSR
jgi:transposase